MTLIKGGNKIGIENNEVTHPAITSLKEFCFISAILCLWCLVVWSDFILQLRLPFHDTMVIHYPWREFISDCVRNYKFPLWDSWNTPGFPITFFNAPVWNPIAYLFFFINDYEISSIMGEIYFLSFISSIGFYLWLKKQEVTYLFAMCGAIVWMASGPFLTSVQGLAIYTTISFVPWIFLSVTLIFTSSDRRKRFLGVAVASMSLWIMVTGGYVGLTVPVIFFLCIYSFFLFCYNYRKTHEIVIAVLVTSFISLLLIAGPITDYLYIKDFMLELRRLAEGGYDPFTSSLPLNSVWTLLLGNGGYLEYITEGRAEQLYMSIPLLLIIPGFIRSVRLNTKDFFFLSLAIFVFLSAMGPESPVARFVVNTVPLISLFRHHVFWSPLIVFLLITVALRIVTRATSQDYLKETSLVETNLVFFTVITVVIVRAIYAFLSGSYSGESYVFPLFELLEFAASVFALFIISLIVFLASRYNNRHLHYFLSFLGVISLSAFCYLFYLSREDIMMLLTKVFGGDGAYLRQTGIGIIHQLLVQRIGLPSVAMLVGDLLYLGLVSLIFVLVVNAYIKTRLKGWIYCFMLLILLDMSFASHRYFHGVLQYLGTPPESEKIIYFEKDIDVNQLAETSEFYYNIVPIRSSVLKGDLINFHLQLKENVESSLSLYIIIYKNGSGERVIEKQFNSSDFSNKRTIAFSGVANSSLTDYLFEIRYYGLKKPPQPLGAKLSIARTVPQKTIPDASNRLLEYTLNSRSPGDYDKPQFYHNRTPVVSTYMPLFNPKIRELASTPNGNILFSKLLWTIPVNEDVNMDLWPMIAKEPNLNSLIMSPNALLVDVVAEEPSRLIWADAWDSGWSATVNGHDVVIEEIFGSIKSVNIPGGRAEVKFSYKRKDRMIAVSMTFIGMLLLVILFASSLFRRSASVKCQRFSC